MSPLCKDRNNRKYSGADQEGGRWGGRPPLGRSFTIQDTLFNSIQAKVRHWAPSPGRNPVSAPATCTQQVCAHHIQPPTSPPDGSLADTAEVN